MARSDHHRGPTFAQTGTRTIFLLIIASLVGLFWLAGCGGGEAPPTEVIYPLAKKCAQGPHFYLSRELAGLISPVIPPGWEEVKNKEVKVFGAPEVGSPITGYFKNKNETYAVWPIEMRIKITMRKIGLPMGQGVSDILKNPAFLNEKSFKPPAVKEKVKEVNIMCHAYKDKSGHWQVTAEFPTDVTPFYQRWWKTLKRKWNA
jgi:hypothetical protein